MNKEEIVKKIEEGGGSFTDNEITFYIEEDSTIWAKNTDKGWSAFLINSNNLPKDWYINFNTGLGNQESYNEFISKLSYTLGYEIPNVKSQIVEVEKVVKDEKTLGMVEAYEKLLIGRDITISK